MRHIIVTKATRKLQCELQPGMDEGWGWDVTLSVANEPARTKVVLFHTPIRLADKLA